MTHKRVVPSGRSSIVDEYRGQVCDVPVEEGAWIVPMRIVDAIARFGRVDIEVEPLYGSGTKWVNLHRVKLR